MRRQLLVAGGFSVNRAGPEHRGARAPSTRRHWQVQMMVSQEPGAVGQRSGPAHQVGLGGGLAGDLGLGVLLQAGVQDGIGHLVGQLQAGTQGGGSGQRSSKSGCWQGGNGRTRAQCTAHPGCHAHVTACSTRVAHAAGVCGNRHDQTAWTRMETGTGGAAGRARHQPSISLTLSGWPSDTDSLVNR